MNTDYDVNTITREGFLMKNQYLDSEKPHIPEHIQIKWQKMIDVLAQTMSVPAVLLIRVYDEQTEVFLTSQTPDNPYPGGFTNSGHISQYVIRELSPLKVTDMAQDPLWQNGNDVSLGMHYYYGLPLLWNDGECFGSISILDSRVNSQADTYENLIQYFKNAIEEDLSLLIDQASQLPQTDQYSYEGSEIYQQVDAGLSQQKSGPTAPVVQADDSFAKLLSNFSGTSFQNMLDGFPEAMIILNHQGYIIGANQAAQALFFLECDIDGQYCFINPKRELQYANSVISLEDLVKSRTVNALPIQNEKFGIEQPNGAMMWFLGNEINLPDIKDNLHIRVLTFQDITDRLVTEAALREREDQFRLKLDSILSPDIEISEQDLSNIIDVEAVESMLQDFSDLTGFLTAIIDVKGNILIATGWSDICTKFHRVHPEMSLLCIESDTTLAKKTRVGEYVEHSCVNYLRSVATPLIIAGKHVADIYTGQFFYEDEVKNNELFEKQAERYGFNKEAYLSALDRVPIVSRRSVKLVMDFLTKFSELVSRLGYSNLKLAKAISEQKRIEAALRESEKHFRMLTSQAPIPIAISNFNNRIDFVNEKFISTFGYTLDDIPDYETWWAKAYPDEEYREFVKEKWEREVNNTMGDMVEVKPFEYHIIAKDGSMHVVEVFGSRIGDKFLGILNDITERKRIEELMIQREKLAGIGTLAAGITHEMNSPLQVITGITDSSKRLLEKGDTDPEELLRRFNVIDKNSWRLARIVRSLLDYARSMPGENAVPCSLNELVNQTLTLTEHQFKSWSNVNIFTHLDETIPMTVLDANQITQVIINLLTNARDAMPNGGDITMWTDYDKSSNMIYLHISDTGSGIPEDVQKKIFDPFFTTKPIGEGTGLGLSIVAGIVRGHHGDIFVESSSKEGTTFKISLPVVQSLLSQDAVENRGRY